MKYSMNLLLWGLHIDESLFPTLDLIQEIGFEGVEVPIANPDPKAWESWRKKLDSLGLHRECDTMCSPAQNLISTDPQIRANALTFLKGTVDCAAVLGATKLMGPLYSALGVFTGQPATSDEWKWGVEGIYKLSEYAQLQNITLGLEYLNRFEVYLVSCADELLQLVQDVNHPNCQIMFDTFHANIEEKNVGDCIRKLGNKIQFIQLSENDRSTPGKGNVDWDGAFKAIKDIGYNGWLSIEAFGPKLPAAHIWRQMYASEEQLMRDGLDFIKSKTIQYQL
jgi:D-psicose/D-tagatose/L-ribulose 3-epimerase